LKFRIFEWSYVRIDRPLNICFWCRFIVSRFAQKVIEVSRGWMRTNLNLFCTAKRLRPKAQGCFNPGKTSADDFNRQAVASFSEPKSQILTASAATHSDFNSPQTFVTQLKQPWALGRKASRYKPRVDHPEVLPKQGDMSQVCDYR
jgi:hypothetical protein